LAHVAHYPVGSVTRPFFAPPLVCLDDCTMDKGKMLGRRGAVLFATLLAATPPALAKPALVVEGTLVELPRTPPCVEKQTTVTTRYRVNRVLSGDHSASEILVVHRCPELARDSTRARRGTAGPLRPGQRHLLRLRPLSRKIELFDRFPQRPESRYVALQTDPAGPLPRVIVKVTSAAGAKHRLEFERTRVSVGRAMSADVLLSSPEVATAHLRLEVRGEKIVVIDLADGRETRVNGRPIDGPHPITYRDKITVGPYTLSAVLLLPPSPNEAATH